MTESNVPDWLTADFLQSCLQSDEEHFQKIAIISHTTESAVPPGNNYGSHMFRVKIQYKNLVDETEDKFTSLIVKAPITAEYMKELMDVYEKEPKFYREFINETYKLCKHNIVPKHYNSPNPLSVVLEDLTTSGYVMVDRLKLLDFDHCELYVKASSRLHALSVAVYNNNPDIIESLVRESPMLTESTQKLHKMMFSNALQCMCAYLEDKPDYKEYLEVIKEASENTNVWNIYQEIEKSKRPLRALIQSDPWCTNMMFKYNSSGRVSSVKLLDFQGLKFNTPVMELVTFLWASANPEVRSTKLNDLYHLYCDSLNENLAELGCSERLSIEDMKADIDFLSPLTLLVICLMVPFCVADGVANIKEYLTADTSKLPVKETSFYQLYQGTYFNKYYPQIIDQAAKEGVFDHFKEKIKQLNSGLLLEKN